jgi:hypothetical protein
MGLIIIVASIMVIKLMKCNFVYIKKVWALVAE